VDVKSEEARVSHKVIVGCDMERGWFRAAIHTEFPHIGNCLGTPVPEEGVLEMPIGMGRGAEDVFPILDQVIITDPDRGKPWLLDKEEVISHVCGKERV